MYVFSYFEITSLEREMLKKCHLLLDVLDKQEKFNCSLLCIILKYLDTEVEYNFCFITNNHNRSLFSELLNNIAEFSDIKLDENFDKGNTECSSFSIRFLDNIFKITILDQYNIDYFYSLLDNEFYSFGQVLDSPFKRDVFLVCI